MYWYGKERQRELYECARECRIGAELRRKRERTAVAGLIRGVLARVLRRPARRRGRHRLSDALDHY